MADFMTSVDIEAIPETVFEYLTSADCLTTWMGEDAVLEATEGGQFHVEVGGRTVLGHYLAVERPRRIVVSWGVRDTAELPEGSSTVEFRLTPGRRTTRVDVLHAGLPEALVARVAGQWEHFLPRLQTAAIGGDAGPDDWQPLPDR